MDQEGFIQQGKAQSITYGSVLREISLLGVRVKTIPQKLRQKHPEVDWSHLEKVGSELISYYWCVDGDAVWSLIREDIPKVLEALKSMLRETKEDLMVMPRKSMGKKELASEEAGRVMKREEMLGKLRAHKKILKERFGITKLQLFGSYSRDEAVKGSDVDLLAYFDEDRKYSGGFGGVYSVRLARTYLEKILGLKVDLIPSKQLRSEVRPHVEKEMVSV